MSQTDRRDVLAALAAFGLALPASASRAGAAGGGAPVFSGARAPEASEGRTGGDLPPARDTAWAERAAILEHDGGWPRPLAEAIADRLTAMEDRGASPDAWAALDAELIRMEQGLV